MYDQNYIRRDSMPSVSKAQQKLFGIVHAIQTGKAKASDFSPAARKLAKTMAKGSVTKYASTPSKHLPNKKDEVAGAIPASDMPVASDDMTPTVSNDPTYVSFDENYSEKQNQILSIVKDKKPAEIDGTLVDIYTAALLTKVLHKLAPENRKKMLALPMEKMVAAAYKLVTR
jgi:hypothetical protein